MQRARQVLCVSQATFERLGQFYPWALEKASVARLGLSELGSRALARAPAFPYFVYVGKRGSYKDFATVLRAFALIPDEISLVAIGGGDPKPHESARLESRLRRRVVFEPYVDDMQLTAWLDGSLGLVCASREEGFGLPPLEALARGKPVILSDIDVFRELYSKWAVFFPVGNHEALAAELEVVARTSPPGPSLSELRSEFSWSETARLTAESYGRALS